MTREPQNIKCNVLRNGTPKEQVEHQISSGESETHQNIAFTHASRRILLLGTEISGEQLQHWTKLSGKGYFKVQTVLQKADGATMRTSLLPVLGLSRCIAQLSLITD